MPPKGNQDGMGLEVWYKPLPSVRVTADIVFIHGITGGRNSTWTAKHADVPWPKAFLPNDAVELEEQKSGETREREEQPLTSARIMTFGYDASVINLGEAASQNCLSDHAYSLLGELDDHRNGKVADRKLIFVAHSLGGLVVKTALLKASASSDKRYEKIFHATQGIAFLGTPHFGSNLANQGEWLVNMLNFFRPANKNIVKVLRPDSEVAAITRDDFFQMLRKFGLDHKDPEFIVCFFEEMPIVKGGRSFMVVPKESAKLGEYRQRSIHADHVTMTKFESQDDPGYKSVASALKRWMPLIVQPVTAPATQAAQAAESRRANATQGGVVQRGGSVGGNVTTGGGAFSMNTSNRLGA